MITIESRKNVGVEEFGLEEIVRGMLPNDKYQNIKKIGKSNGTRRANFSANWGRKGGARPVRIKLDMRPRDDRSRDMTDRGYGTENETNVLSNIPYDEALAHGISPILDYKEENGIVVSVEPEFIGGNSLGEFFKDRVPTKKEFNEVISGITKAVGYAQDNGFYKFFHRDLTDSNIMARNNCGSLEIRLTDAEFAVPTDKVRDAPHTTSGTRSLRDPLLETQAYGHQSEVYQIAMNALMLYNRDPLNWNDNEELRDAGKRKAAVKEAILKMPKNIRKRHGKWIERALSLDAGERFENFEEFKSAVYRATTPGFIDNLKKKWKSIGATVLATAALAGVGTLVYNTHLENLHLQEIAEARIPIVETHWNGKGMEMTNDQIKLEVSLSGYGTEENKKLQSYQWYPTKHNSLRVEPGEELNFLSMVSAKIGGDGIDNLCLSFQGRYYIEGERLDDGNVSEEFYVYAENPDEAKREYDHGYWNPSSKYFRVPKNLKEGVYVFAAEIFAPSDEERTKENIHISKNSSVSNNWAKADIRFAHPGKAIARVRVPLIVGKPELEAEVYNVGLRSFGPNNWYARKLDEEVTAGIVIANKKSINFFAEMPGTDYFNKLTELYGLGLPNSDHAGEQKDLIFHTRDSAGKIIGFTGVPVESRGIFTQGAIDRGYVKQQLMWDFGEVDKDFPKRLVEYKESLPYQKSVPKEGEKDGN